METSQEKNLREKRIIDFEKKFGTDLFLKTVLSTFSKILVEKGIASEEEINERFDERMFEVEKEYRKFEEWSKLENEGNEGK